MILRDEEGKELVFDTEAGQLVLTFKDGLPQDLDVSLVWILGSICDFL